jgi:hypothetical protein
VVVVVLEALLVELIMAHLEQQTQAAVEVLVQTQAQ